MKHLLKLTICLFMVASGYAQEELSPLMYDGARLNTYQEELRKQSTTRDVTIGQFNYVIDSLEMPFIDDFTQDRIKRYKAKKLDDNVVPRVTYAYTISGANPDTFSASFDTTFNTFKYINGVVEHEATPALELLRFDLETGEVTGTDTVWSNIVSEFDESFGLVTFDTLGAEFAESNTSDTVFFVTDDNSLWVTPVQDTGDRGPYINNTWARNMPSQGVATFDGTDAAGYPYDISSETSYGLADELESKPILIDSLDDDLFLSFYYQSTGNGNDPDEEDSLVVDFYSPEDDAWYSVWHSAGQLQDDSSFTDQVFIELTGRRFKFNGFRFRFRNYATLSGSLDHWHIDYVRLDRNRDTALDKNVEDVALIYGAQTYLDQYMEMPYRHYLEAPIESQTNSISMELRNLGEAAVFAKNIRCDLYDEDENLLDSISTRRPSLEPLTSEVVSLPLQNDQRFPELPIQYPVFHSVCSFEVQGAGNDYLVNDTIIRDHGLYDYYAYDDGSAEQAYAVTGAGVKLAYRFTAPIEDTLRAIFFNLPQTLHDQNPELPMRLIIWSDLNATPLYESEFTVPARYTNANEFVRFDLEEPVVVGTTFYIGYQQIEATKIFIGFDVNTNSGENIFYAVNDDWFPSGFTGSLMMRPDFGESDYSNGIVTVKKAQYEVNVFPNPATDRINIDVAGEAFNGMVNVFAIDGTLVDQIQMVYGEREMNVSGLSNGLYILQFTEEGSGNSASSKLLIRN